ncbi:MAG: hypothetical protein ACFB4J_10760 [Elainellaceae cyanobacterium]
MITQLRLVESALASQETQLAAALSTVRQKRQSLQTVIQMFTEPEDADLPLTEAAIAAGVESDSAQKNGTLNGQTKGENAVDQQDSGQGLPEPFSEQPALQSGTPADEPEASAKAEPKLSKPSRRRKRVTQSAKRKTKVTVAPWQFHVRAEYQDISLPKAVRNVLQESPDEVVEISDIIARIFVSDIPEEAHASARDRLSNVLSVGLKKAHWYRGKTGHYSISEAVAKASRS